MIRKAMRLAVLALAVACALPAWADYEEGRRAWDAGRPDEALAQWRAAADDGDRRAMLALGRLYAQGMGAPQDYVEAHKWFNLAASRGEADAVEERDGLAAKMTPQQVQAAQALARSWQPGGLPGEANYEEGRQAWDAGRPDEALARWRTAADDGDRRAMLALGRLYAQGLGASQDYVEAHKWFNLAASRGKAAAVEERDGLAAKMTPQQVQAAQALARSWQPGGGVAEGTAGTAGNSGATAPAPATASDAGASPPRAVREAQRLLAGMGYAPGPADGIWGRRTALAYRLFLAAAGLPPAERLTPEALRAMRAMAKGAAPGGTAPVALHRAAQAGDVAGLQAVLSAGVDVDARDGRGWTALMYAVNKDQALLVEPLLAAGANPDLRAPDGATALFMAAVRGHTEAIGLLMDAGAEISVKGPKGKTVVDVARMRYGEAAEAKENGAPAAVVALLEGRTLAERRRGDDEAFERAKSEGTVSAFDGYLSLCGEGCGHGEEARRLREEALRAPGRKFRDCAGCPELVVVPPGNFMMGSSSGDGKTGPAHRVEIGRAFAVGVKEVTFGEWDACVSGGGCGHRPDDKGSGRRNRPVVNVSWQDAQEYVEWLSRETRGRYRLLSESEWEYVRRPASGFGLRVSGDIWEWVDDCWNDTYHGAPTDGSAWMSGDCARRVLRGGSGLGVPQNLRSADRGRLTTGYRSILGGFRVARTLD